MFEFDVAPLPFVDRTLFYTSIIIVVLTIVFYILLQKTKNPKLKTIFVVLITFLVCQEIFTLNFLKTSYSLTSFQEYWKKNDLPQIDESMHLVFMDFRGCYFMANDRDSIQHQRKSVTYDWRGLDRVSDLFENKKTNQYAVTVFEPERKFRKEKRVYYLVDKVSGNSEDLYRYQFDSIITDWGLFDKAYKIIPTGNPYKKVIFNKK